MSLVFYDTETTGTETYFDQILQFAAIKTDSELNEIGRFEIRCRLLPHIVPAPGAMRVTGVNASMLTDPALPSHYGMLRDIRSKLLEWSPAIFMGYNSVEFDENLIRQALYKTLHPPYLTNTNGNARSDVLRMAQACSLFMPDVLVVPDGDNGKRTFKLDRIAPANGFAHKNAHDAMADVEATIFMSRLIKDKAPDVWSSFMRFSKKAAVQDYITAEPTFCLAEFYFGRPFAYLVTTLRANSENSSEWYVYDLSVHPEALQALTDEQLASRLGRSPKPLRRLKANAAPMIFHADLAPDICKAKECASDELAARLERLTADEAFRDRLTKVFESQKEEYPPSPHIERQIYDGFFTPADQSLMEAFHKADWPERLAIIPQFQDPRLKTLGTHLMHLERPDLLAEDIRQEHSLLAAKRLLGHHDSVEWLTLPKAIEEMNEMLATATASEKEFLEAHHAYLLARFEDATKMVG